MMKRRVILRYQLEEIAARTQSGSSDLKHMNHSESFLAGVTLPSVFSAAGAETLKR